ncbi:hypothetical protein ACHAP5_012020 [Fusarium lateritium]
MAPQEEPTEDEAAMQHLKVKGLYPRGPFSEPFPGLHPTLAQRRRYMRAFFQWHLYDAEPKEHERELREHAERNIATAVIDHALKEGQDILGIPTVMFEYGVDAEVWQSWFRNCPKESIPDWPWPCPKTEAGDPESSKFAELLAKYKKEGTLFPSSKKPEDIVSSKATASAGKPGKTTNVVQSAKPAAPSPSPAVAPPQSRMSRNDYFRKRLYQNDDDDDDSDTQKRPLKRKLGESLRKR